ncbi:MAG: CBS domain-containing protein [Bacteriovoracaceae bacterium]|nr:CBS domain-containing protein [Bacteriovoracaceae bacterium]
MRDDEDGDIFNIDAIDSDDNTLFGLEQKVEQKGISDLQVWDFMTLKVISARKGDSIGAVIKMFQTHKISGASVINDRNKLIGVISEYDLLLQAASKDLSTPIDFNEKVFSIKGSTTLKETIVLFYKKRYRRFFVTDQLNALTGVISRIDVLSKLLHKDD